MWGGGIAYLDDDDEWLPEKLEKQVAKFAECSENVAVVFNECYFITNGNYEMKRQSSYSKCLYNAKNVYSELLKHNFIAIFALARVQALVEVGGFDENLHALEDWDIWLRLARHYDFACIDEPLVNVYLYDNIKHVNRNTYNKANALSAIIKKNSEAYSTTHRNYQYVMMLKILDCYISAGCIKKGFMTCLDLLYFMPLRTPRTFMYIMKSLLKRELKAKTPKLFYWLKQIYLKIKGENL